MSKKNNLDKLINELNNMHKEFDSVLFSTSEDEIKKSTINIKKEKTEDNKNSNNTNPNNYTDSNLKNKESIQEIKNGAISNVEDTEIIQEINKTIDTENSFNLTSTDDSENALSKLNLDLQDQNNIEKGKINTEGYLASKIENEVTPLIEDLNEKSTSNESYLKIKDKLDKIKTTIHKKNLDKNITITNSLNSEPLTENANLVKKKSVDKLTIIILFLVIIILVFFYFLYF